MSKIECVDTLATALHVLSKSGLLLTGEVTKIGVLKLALNFLVITITDMFILLNIRIGVRQNNIELTNWMICVLIQMTTYTMKSLTLLVNRKHFLSILQDLSSDSFNRHDSELNRHIQLTYKISRLMIKYFGFAGSLYLTCFCVLPFAINIRMTVSAPFDTGRYDIVYKISHLTLSCYVAINMLCLDIFYMTLMRICIAQLDILTETLANILGNINNLQKLKTAKVLHEINIATEHTLKKCIILHNIIMEFVRKLNIVLAFPLFAQYTCGCLIICNTILQITLMGGGSIANLISMSSYSSIALTEIAVYHWLANEIMFKSNKIVESCYSSKWYECNMVCQKSLLLLMQGAQKPLVVRLYNLIYISLDSLGVIIRWSYSMFALMRASIGRSDTPSI